MRWTISGAVRIRQRRSARLYCQRSYVCWSFNWRLIIIIMIKSEYATQALLCWVNEHDHYYSTSSINEWETFDKSGRDMHYLSTREIENFDSLPVYYWFQMLRLYLM